MFTVILWVIAKKKKKKKTHISITGEKQIYSEQSIVYHTMEYHLAIQRSEVLIHPTGWKTLTHAKRKKPDKSTHI